MVHVNNFLFRFPDIDVVCLRFVSYAVDEKQMEQMLVCVL